MKVQLKAGAEIDLLSTEEYRQEQEKLRKHLGKDDYTVILESAVLPFVALEGAANWYTIGTFGWDSTNNVATVISALPVYTVPVGFTGKLFRFSAVIPTAQSATPNSFIAVCRNTVTNIIDANYDDGTYDGTPWSFADGKDSAAFLRGGDTIMVYGYASNVATLKAGSQMFVNMQIGLHEVGA